MQTKYETQPPKAFWKQCRQSERFLIDQLYTPKFDIGAGTKIASAGSCFAQHIGRHLRQSDVEFLDVETAPEAMPANVAARFGYGIYSARYGNIYTARQLRQLLEDAISETVHDCAIWEKDAYYVDALRPGVEPYGLISPQEVALHRLDHLRRVRQLCQQSDIFIFTIGLTEAWIDRASGVVFPTVPGLIAGTYSETLHGFVNFGFTETYADLVASIDVMRLINPGLRFLLTVSPVPLTATATDKHALAATTYSKSVLRAVAGTLAADCDFVDYFPSYEIITGAPFQGQFYNTNLRTVTPKGVNTVMSVFFEAHGMKHVAPQGTEPLQHCAFQATTSAETVSSAEDDDMCEDVMLESFSRT